MKNYRNACFIGTYDISPALNKEGTWLGPVIRSILLKKYVLLSWYVHPYLWHKSVAILIYVWLRYSLIIFLVI
jgi:hypothetical protein